MTFLNENNRYHTTNPLVNNEDIMDHIGIGAVIHDINYPERILLFYHAKYQFYTIPIGKVRLHDNPEIGMITEIKEETGITVNTFKLLGTFKKRYHRGGKIYTDVNSHLYDIVSYNSEPNNLEPLKHPVMAWMTVDEILKFPKNKISDLTRFYIALKEIIEFESKQLVQ